MSWQKIKTKGETEVMSKNVCKLFRTIDIGELLEIIAPCMDDFLYVLDLQKNTMDISQSATKRFMLSEAFLENVSESIMPLVYEEDRAMLEKHLKAITDGTEKNHNLHYRWIGKDGMPVWINCRGVVIDDENGVPCYLIGCLNETGRLQRADNVTGLLGGMEFGNYLHSKGKSITKGFLMHIGIDDFGVINGAKGGAYGNFVLRGVADCMKQCLSSHQKIFHLVADEYVIVDLESETMEDAVLLRKEISAKIYEFIVSEQFEAVFSISIGVMQATNVLAGHEESREKFDFCLKQAKKMGKNGLYFFDQKDYDAFLRKGKVISAIRSAITRNYDGFAVYFQPIVDCKTKKVLGAEALMRFFMPTEDGMEFVSPLEFIPLLEETGLIIPTGRYILAEAAKMCREIQETIPEFSVNVNISYVQIMQGNVADDITGIIKKYGLHPKSLCIEMTESGFMDMTPAFCAFRDTLEENGIPFIIDDFGTGYSNLHCISDMNPTYIKMDRDFTAKAMSNARDYALFRNIVAMVHSINVEICVEGMEEEEWCEKMQDMQVDYLQGYLFGRPCEKAEFIRKL